MSLSTLSHILDFFSGKEPTPEERHDLVNETLMLVLSRATESDTNIHPVEVETVREMVQKRTGEDVTTRPRCALRPIRGSTSRLPWKTMSSGSRDRSTCRIA